MFYAAVYGLFAQRGLPMFEVLHQCDGWENMSALRLFIQSAMREPMATKYDAVLIVLEDDTIGVLGPSEARNGLVPAVGNGLKL